MLKCGQASRADPSQSPLLKSPMFLIRPKNLLRMNADSLFPVLQARIVRFRFEFSISMIVSFEAAIYKCWAQ